MSEATARLLGQEDYAVDRQGCMCRGKGGLCQSSVLMNAIPAQSRWRGRTVIIGVGATPDGVCE